MIKEELPTHLWGRGENQLEEKALTHGSHPWF